MPQKLRKIFFVLFLVILFVVLFFLNSKDVLTADGSVVAITKIEPLEGDKPYELQTIKSDNGSAYRIRYGNGFNYKTLELPGFQDNIQLCEEEQVDLGGNLENAICLIGEVGVHSENFMLFKKVGSELTAISFLKDGAYMSNVISDSPNIIKKDYNGDGMVDILVDNRDYDSSEPYSSIKRDYYRGTDSGFIFDRTDSLQYDKIN